MNPALPVDEESPILDLRSWLEQVRQLGKLKEVQGASWDLEVGTLTDLNVKSRKWTLLFDEIQDYPPGYRVVTGSLLDSGRVALRAWASRLPASRRVSSASGGISSKCLVP